MVKLSRQAKIKILCGLFLLLTIGSVDARSPVPVIFIHGLAGSADTWKSFGDFLQQNGWSFGGCPISLAPGSAGNFCPPTASLSPGDFYRVQFSDNQNLTFIEQGEELGSVIDVVLSLNPATSSLVLIAHSMGGLAARSYIQIHQATDVLKLITVGTPHKGSRVADFCQSSTLNAALCEFSGINPFSVAVTSLMPGSTGLENLNNLTMQPLPDHISYTSIIGSGTRVLPEGFTDGDGIVSSRSQNLRNVKGTHRLNHRRISIRIIDRRSCDPGFGIPGVPNQTHTCESTDVGVWTTLLELLRPSEESLTSTEQAQLDTLKRAARDRQFHFVLLENENFGEDLNSDTEWKLRWRDFNFKSRFTGLFYTVRILHRTNKLNASLRYTNFQDPVTLKWAGWRRAR